jgi:CRISPR-associated protein Cas5t
MTVTALEVTVTAPVVSFRNPLYAAVQAGLPCPPPATVGGLLAAARGGWPHVDTTTRFAMAFQAKGHGVDLETYHPLDASGRAASPTPRDRDFLADVTLTVWLVDDVAVWQAALRRPVWPLRLGRSQDLVGTRTRSVHLESGQGRQGYAVVPSERTGAGTLLQLPTAVSMDRLRTRWDTYRYASSGADDQIGDGCWVDAQGQAVVLLPAIHPDCVGSRA